MNIDFNNVRKQAIYRHDELVRLLNNAILKKTQWAKPNDVYHNQEIDIKGYVLIDKDDLHTVLNDLRMLIGTIASTYEPGDISFKDVYSEVFEEENKSMEEFDPEIEGECSD